MITIKSIKINHNNNMLNSEGQTIRTVKQQNNKNWLNVVNVDNHYDLSEKYHAICQNHRIDNKWILMINPENESLGRLSSLGKIDATRVLRVNTNKVKVNIDNVKSTLIKGNCAAVILSNAQLTTTELSLIAECAEKGQTQCIVLNHASRLH